MRILLIHAEEVWYRTGKPAVANPPDPPGEYRDSNAVVAYVSVEKGDDDASVELAAEEIYEYAANTVKSDSIVIYPYAHLSSILERPGRAHSILVKLESALRAKWHGRLHRAPFGWYKEFQLHAKGHPLAELSRQVSPATVKAWYRAGGKRYALGEAASTGILPACLAEPRLEFNDVGREKLELFGLSGWRGWIAWEMTGRLARRASTLYGSIQHYNPAPSLDPSSAISLEALADLYRAAWDSPTNSMVGSPQPSAVLRVAGDPRRLLSEVSGGLEKRLVEVPLCGGEPCLELGFPGLLLFYNGGSTCIPVAVVLGEGGLLGPLGNILLAALHAESSLAESSDYTPRLPVWLHPVTAYIATVGETREYAGTLARELAGVGAGVLIDSSKASLGGKVRSAGKMWTPYTITVGVREAETATVTVRRRWRPGEQEVLTLSEVVSEVRSLLSAYGVSGFVRELS